MLSAAALALGIADSNISLHQQDGVWQMGGGGHFKTLEGEAKRRALLLQSTSPLHHPGRHLSVTKPSWLPREATPSAAEMLSTFIHWKGNIALAVLLLALAYRPALQVHKVGHATCACMHFTHQEHIADHAFAHTGTLS